MDIFIVLLALFTGQTRTLQDRPLVHLHPNQNSIPVDFGGSLVELINPPAVIQLPRLPPKPDTHGTQWFVDISNPGTTTVTIVGNAQFRVQIKGGGVVHIKSVVSGYLIKN